MPTPDINRRMAAAILKALKEAGSLNVMALKDKVPSVTSEQLKLMRKAGLIRVEKNAWVALPQAEPPKGA